MDKEVMSASDLPLKHRPLFYLGVVIGFIMAMTEPPQPRLHWKELI